LNTISSPNQYLLSFDAQDGSHINGKWCNLIDATSWFPIPQPEYTVSSSPSSINLRPGEERNDELRIASPIQRSGISHVILSSEPTNDLEINLKPPILSIPSLGSNVSIIHIKAQENTKYEQLPFIHTITINAVITIPDFTPYGATSSEVKSNSLTGNISKGFSNLTITLLPPMTFQEQFSAFWNTYGSLVSLVGGGFAAGFAALVFNRLTKTK
jgi:hypothetical protein